MPPQQPLAGPGPLDRDLARPDTLGPWRLVSEIGRGGMAVVYLAERIDGQFDRRVAIKLIGGHPSPELLGRLETERRILAALDHPNIARLLDAGISDRGQPYLVMEYIEGQPIDQYCRERQLDVAARLRLFSIVARAVHHAHRSLVVHRDLKPSNILVTGEGVPKLLDFGIAKILDPEDSMLPVAETLTGTRLMTPEYASPEQVAGLSVTTASDVYSLGVVLYELLTGHKPFRMQGRTFRQWELMVLERDPTRPSSVAAGEVHDARLARRLRGDLDRIVLMALRKEPDRRYASAEQLTEDIERHLGGRPVRAMNPGRWYIFRKFALRHRLELAGASVALLSLVAGTVFSLQQARLARRERDRAHQARVEAEAVTSFLSGLFEAADPADARGDSVTARELLERGVGRAEGLAGQPSAQARMLTAVGEVYRNLGQFDKAESLLVRALEVRRKAWGPEHVEVAAGLSALAVHYRVRGDAVRGDSLLREALAMQRRLLPPGDPAIATSLSELARLKADQSQDLESERLYREALTIRRRALGPTHRDVAISLRNVGAILRRQRRYAEAVPFYQDALATGIRALGPDHPDVIFLKQQLATVLLDLPESWEASERLFRDAVASARKVLGDDHRGTADAISQLAWCLTTVGELEEAEALHREALERRRRTYGPGHYNTAGTMLALADHLAAAGKYEEADQWYRSGTDLYQQVFGPDHGSVAGGLTGRGRLLLRTGRLDEAEQAFRRALGIRQLVKSDAPIVADVSVDLAEVLIARGKTREAEPLLLSALAIYQAAYREADPVIARTREMLNQLHTRGRR
jgi:tetratricopeptide (TPR) repeat protein